MSQENEPKNEEETQSKPQEEQEEILKEDEKKNNPLEEAQNEAKEYKEKYLRAHADFENMKKRLEKDKQNAIIYANEGFAKDMLSVIDSFEQALHSIDGADEEHKAEILDKMKEGVKLTYEQLKKTLEKNHIKEVVCTTEFDPECHQAIMQVESNEHKSGQIVQIMQKGYKIKDRLLRPAMVSTSK